HGTNGHDAVGRDRQSRRDGDADVDAGQPEQISAEDRELLGGRAVVRAVPVELERARARAREGEAERSGVRAVLRGVIGEGRVEIDAEIPAYRVGDGERAGCAGG